MPPIPLHTAIKLRLQWVVNWVVEYFSVASITARLWRILATFPSLLAAPNSLVETSLTPAKPADEFIIILANRVSLNEQYLLKKDTTAWDQGIYFILIIIIFNVHALKCTTMYYSCLYTQSFIKNTLENELDVKFDEYNVVNYTPKEYQDPQLGDGNLYTTLVCGHLHTVLLR